MPKPLIMWHFVGKDQVSSDGRFEIRERVLENPKTKAKYFQGSTCNGLSAPETRLFVIDHIKDEVHVLLPLQDATAFAAALVAKEG